LQAGEKYVDGFSPFSIGFRPPPFTKHRHLIACSAILYMMNQRFSLICIMLCMTVLLAGTTPAASQPPFAPDPIEFADEDTPPIYDDVSPAQEQAIWKKFSATSKHYGAWAS
jgi:hypothetical protein